MIAPLPGAAQTADLPGYDRLDVQAAHRARPIAASIWYPAAGPTFVAPVGDNALFEGRPAYMGAAMAEGKFPLILLSHGSGGNMDGAAWLSAELAQRGAVVLAVNHQGSTSGDSSPRRTLYLGTRAADLSAALDQVMNNPEFSAHIDPDRITSVGFSLGGTTVLGLAGMRFDPKGMGNACKESEDPVRGCNFYQNAKVNMADLPEDFGADARDTRIGATIAIDPGFTQAAREDSLSLISDPVLLINLGAADTLWNMVDVGPNGTDLAARLPNATRNVIAPADHYGFLMNCKPGAAEILAEENDDPICDDPQGADRKQIHQQIIDQIADFVNL
ncbi:alpha/beta fold hydrolase [Paracoccus sp. M683]|nr:alpha/beta fold hydrolase [Paracoccus sp. M683]